MPVTAVLSPELCNHIVQWAGFSRRDMCALSLVSKAFQREAEVRLYTSVRLLDAGMAAMLCRTLLRSERHALLVRSFWFSTDHSRRGQTPVLPRSFWAVIREVLGCMANLKNLTLCDSTSMNSWIFDTPCDIKFQLTELELQFTWDAHIIRFLQHQRKLQHLYMTATVPPPELVELSRLPTTDISLPNLRHLHSCLLVAQYLQPMSPLTNAQFNMSQYAQQRTLPVLRRMPHTLRGLTLLGVAPKTTAFVLDTVSRTCPNLRHIGHLHLPVKNRQDFIDCLMRLRNLASVELNLTLWNPAPEIPAQRALAAELKTFCPSIHQVVFWLGNSDLKVFWGYYADTWRCKDNIRQLPPHSGHWMHF